MAIEGSTLDGFEIPRIGNYFVYFQGDATSLAPVSGCSGTTHERGETGAASGTVTFDSATADPSPGQIIFIKSTDGTGVSYEANTTASGLTSGFTGANQGGGLTGAINLEIAIAGVSGHNGKILVQRNARELILTQKFGGTAGDNTITENADRVVVTGFAGGATFNVSDLPTYNHPNWFLGRSGGTTFGDINISGFILLPLKNNPNIGITSCTYLPETPGED